MKKITTMRPESIKEEARTAVKSGMSVKDVSKLLDVPYGTIRGWIRPKVKKLPGPYICPDCQQTFEKSILFAQHRSRCKKPVVPMQSVITPQARMTLDEFVNLLHDLVGDYERTKTRLHELEKSVEKWKQMAGLLNTQLNRS